VSAGKYVLLVGCVKTIVGRYEKVRVVEFDRTPENTLVAWSPSVDCNEFELPSAFAMAVGVSMVGVPVRITVPDGSVG
jgi:hypothetical protein